MRKHVANISTDKVTSCRSRTLPVNKFTTFFSEQCVFRLLDTVRPSATGLDKIPSWFLRIAAPLSSVPTAYIFNTSLSFSVVPDQWMSSSITPVPKITSPLICQDFRPISVTPVLSRLFEEEFVRQNLPSPCPPQLHSAVLRPVCL